MVVFCLRFRNAAQVAYRVLSSRRRSRLWQGGPAVLSLMASAAAHASVAALFLSLDAGPVTNTGKPLIVDIVVEPARTASDARALPAVPVPEPAKDTAEAPHSQVSKQELIAQEVAVASPQPLGPPLPPRRPSLPTARILDPSLREPEPFKKRAEAASGNPPAAHEDEASRHEISFQPPPGPAKTQTNHEPAAFGGQRTEAVAASGNPLPPYPPKAVRKGLEGRVILDVEVLITGRVGNIKVIESSGHGLLDRAAIKGVREWRFKPAKFAGINVRSRVSVPVRFELER